MDDPQKKSEENRSQPYYWNDKINDYLTTTMHNETENASDNSNSESAKVNGRQRLPRIARIFSFVPATVLNIREIFGH